MRKRLEDEVLLQTQLYSDMASMQSHYLCGVRWSLHVHHLFSYFPSGIYSFRVSKPISTAHCAQKAKKTLVCIASRRAEELQKGSQKYSGTQLTAYNHGNND
jgi:hypothetical protein